MVCSVVRSPQYGLLRSVPCAGLVLCVLLVVLSVLFGVCVAEGDVSACAVLCCYLDSLRGSSDNIGTIQRRLAWPLRKDDTHKSRSVNIFLIFTHTTSVRADRNPIDTRKKCCVVLWRRVRPCRLSLFVRPHGCGRQVWVDGCCAWTRGVGAVHLVCGLCGVKNIVWNLRPSPQPLWADQD